ARELDPVGAAGRGHEHRAVGVVHRGLEAVGAQGAGERVADALAGDGAEGEGQVLARDGVGGRRGAARLRGRDRGGHVWWDVVGRDGEGPRGGDEGKDGGAEVGGLVTGREREPAGAAGRGHEHRAVGVVHRGLEAVVSLGAGERVADVLAVPTRRSSDLVLARDGVGGRRGAARLRGRDRGGHVWWDVVGRDGEGPRGGDEG